MAFNAAKAGATATWTAGTKTCANTYCHGSTLTGGTTKNPVWGATLTGCGTCHGFPPATGSHTGVTATQCVNCHTHVNATGTGFTNAALHINGTIDAAGGGDCVSCHGALQGTGTRRVVGTDTILASRHIVATTINQNSFQVELFFSGPIRITTLAVASAGNLVGLSRGTGLDPYFVELDLSAAESCGEAPLARPAATPTVTRDL